MEYKIVIDTSVLISGLYSNRGAAFKLLEEIDHPDLKVYVSTSLILEYEAVAKRETNSYWLDSSKLDVFIDFICSKCLETNIYFNWRPFLSDPNDDFVLELAVASGAEWIVTYNDSDFKGSDKFGVKTITPKELLMKMGVLK